MYLLLNLVDGEIPNYQAVPDDYTPKQGEVVVQDVPTGWIWDASLGALREPNSADLLRFAKRDKKAQFSLRAIQEMRGLYSEMTSLPNAPSETWLAEALVEVVRNNNPARRQALADVVAKRKRTHTAVDAKSTISEVQALTWEGIA